MKPKASPLTFKSLKFLRVFVEVDFESKVKVKDFDFDGVRLGFSVKHTKLQDGTWAVMLGFVSTNEKSDVLCPYEIDIQAVGTFSVALNFPEDKVEKLVYENGTALIYGAIRDMVVNITSRSSPGPIILPTPTFAGEYEEYLRQKNETAKALEDVTPVDKPKRKSTARKKKQ